MAMEPTSRGHYTQMQMQDRRLKLERERMAQQQQQLNQRLAAERDARLGRVGQAIGMAFLDTGLATARDAARLGLKKAFSDPYEGYTSGALYKAAAAKYGTQAENKKEEKKVSDGVTDALTPKPPAVDPNDMTPDQMKSRLDALAQSGLTVSRARGPVEPSVQPLLQSVPGRPMSALPAQQSMARKEDLASGRSLTDPYGDVSKGVVSRQEFGTRMPSVRPPAATAPEEPVAPVEGAVEVSGQLAIPRRDGGRVRFTRDQRQATKKVIGVDPATQTKRVKPLEGEYRTLFKDPRIAQREAFDRMLNRVQAEADKYFPKIRELSKKELDELDADDRRMYANALAAREELVRQRVATMTQNLMQKEQFARANLPTLSQISSSERQASRISQSYVPGASRKTTANAIDLVLRRGALVKMSDVQSILAGETNKEKKDQIKARLDDTDRTMIEMGGNANLEVEMSQEEANALLAFTKFHFGRKAKGVLNAGGKKFRNNDDTFLKNITFVKPAKYANSAGYNNNLWDKLDEFAGSGIGDHIRDEGPGSASREAQRNAQAMAREIIPLYNAWKKGRVPGVKKPTLEQRVQFADDLYERGRELEKVLRAYSITRVDSPKSDERSERKAGESARKQFSQLQGEYTSKLRSLSAARKSYDASVRGSDRSIALDMLGKEMTSRSGQRDFKRFKENDSALSPDKRAAIASRLDVLQSTVSDERKSSRGAAADDIKTYQSDLQRIYDKMKSLKSENEGIGSDLPTLPKPFQFKDREGKSREFKIQAQVSPSDDRLLNEGLRRAQRMAAAGASQEQQNDFLVRFYRANGLSRDIMKQVERAAQSQRVV